jgi:hypothetical protein
MNVQTGPMSKIASSKVPYASFESLFLELQNHAYS